MKVIREYKFKEPKKHSNVFEELPITEEIRDAAGLPDDKRILGNIYVSRGIVAKRIRITVEVIE